MCRAQVLSCPRRRSARSHRYPHRRRLTPRAQLRSPSRECTAVRDSKTSNHKETRSGQHRTLRQGVDQEGSETEVVDKKVKGESKMWCVVYSSDDALRSYIEEQPLPRRSHVLSYPWRPSHEQGRMLHVHYLANYAIGRDPARHYCQGSTFLRVPVVYVCRAVQPGCAAGEYRCGPTRQPPKGWRNPYSLRFVPPVGEVSCHDDMRWHPLEDRLVSHRVRNYFGSSPVLHMITRMT